MYNSSEQKPVKISFLLYLITFLPYLYLVLIGIAGENCGLFGRYQACYGLEAMEFTFIIHSLLVPIYPIIILFQIIYTTIKYKAFNKTQKIIAKSALIPSAILISSLIFRYVFF